MNIESFDVFAPELCHKSNTYLANMYGELCNYESSYFWFLRRRELICFLIRKYFPESVRLCDIGCGGGYILAGIMKKFPSSELFGSDIFIAGLKFAQGRVPAAKLFQSDILHFPYESEFDFVGAFDVLEHIDDDVDALKNIYLALRPSGGVIITVPQYQRLWTVSDESASHKRRYSRKDLVRKCEQAGFKVLRATSYMSLLFPFVLADVFLNRRKQVGTKSFKINPLLNKIFGIVCGFENMLAYCGINFCIGGSLVLVLKKQG